MALLNSDLRNVRLRLIVTSDLPAAFLLSLYFSIRNGLICDRRLPPKNALRAFDEGTAYFLYV